MEAVHVNLSAELAYHQLLGEKPLKINLADTLPLRLVSGYQAEAGLVFCIRLLGSGYPLCQLFQQLTRSSSSCPS